MRPGTLRMAAAFAALLALPLAQADGVASAREMAVAGLARAAADPGPFAANVAEAAASNGLDPAAWPTPDHPILAQVAVPPEGAANVTLLRPLRALALAGDARAAPDGPLTQRVLALFRDDGFGDPRALNDDAYAILALRAAGIPAQDARVQAARSHILATQGAGGGWGWGTTTPAGTDMTGLALQALAESGGVPATVQAQATSFLLAARTDAGFAETPGGQPNCESTVWGLRATHLAGHGARDADWRFLLRLQRADGGFAHLPGGAVDVLCTTDAAALLGDVQAGRLPGPPTGGAKDAPANGALPSLAALAAAAVARAGRRR